MAKFVPLFGGKMSKYAAKYKQSAISYIYKLNYDKKWALK
jgi:hypothetical protein